jgi:quercetin dioxygenase-like cupin family protein
MTIDVTTPADAETLFVVADRIRFLGGVPGSAAELVDIEVPPGSGTPPHTHLSPELFYVLAGELTMREFPEGAPPKVVRAGPGTAVRIPSMVPHNYVNDSGAPVRVLVLLEPAMVTFFREIGTPTPPEGAPDFAAIGAAMARHGIEALPAAA